MTEFHVIRKEIRVADLVEMRPRLDLAPDYQREGQIWTLERQRLFIDSILNGFDVPAIYLHALRPPSLSQGHTHSHAVIDGRQRLEALWDFVDGTFGLADDFEFLPHRRSGLDDETATEGDRTPYGGLRYDDLFFAASELHYRFNDYSVPVTTVETSDVSLIEELFFRLNEGVPLTAAEKRNRGRLLRELIVPLVETDELLSVARFPRRRRNYSDLLLRLIYLEDAGLTREHVPDLKKKALDDFAASFREPIGGWAPGEESRVRDRMRDLISRARPVLETLSETFQESDPLLKRMTDYIAYYIAYRWMMNDRVPLPARSDWAQLHESVQSLKGRSEEELTESDFRLLDLAKPIQGATTGSYYRERAAAFYDFARGAF